MTFLVHCRDESAKSFVARHRRRGLEGNCGDPKTIKAAAGIGLYPAASRHASGIADEAAVADLNRGISWKMPVGLGGGPKRR